MKRLVVVLVLALALLVPGAVLANGNSNPLKDLLDGYGDHKNDDGKLIEFECGDKYSILKGIERDEYRRDEDSSRVGDQKVSVTIPTKAYIPCYLEIVVTGNQGKTTVKSFGPSSEASKSPRNYVMVFDNEVGGFVNHKWESLGHGKNAEVAPADKRYIQACDVYRVQVWSNDNYRYYVKAEPLRGDKGELDLQMRTSVDGRRWGRTVTFENQRKVEIAERRACKELTVLHQFRVPYTRNVAHGKYEGEVTFLAVTL